MALAGKGRTLIYSGEGERGLDLLNEAAAAATCGELRPFATGVVYCSTLSSCQDLGDVGAPPSGPRPPLGGPSALMSAAFPAPAASATRR